MQAEELEALKKTIKRLPPDSICVNIGAGFGTSGMAFIESEWVKELYTIDIFDKIAENGLGSLEFERNVFDEFGFLHDPRYHQILGDSIKIGEKWNKPLDMVFIDGDHSYEHCQGDINTWMPLIKKGGIIAFHDYLEPAWPGVGRAIDELITYKSDMLYSAKCFASFRI